MKQGNTLVNFVMLLLATALAIYFGFYVVSGLRDPFTTTYVYEYVISDGVTVDGLIARTEQVLPAQSGILDVRVAEGERVATGQTIAAIYRDNRAVELRGTLEKLEMEQEILRSAMAQEGDASSSARLDETILQSVVNLRAAYAADNYSRLESQVLQVKSSVLKRDYTYSDTLSAADLQAQLGAISGEISAISSQASPASVLRAPAAGTYSARVDGYEGVISGTSVFTLTARDLKELMSRPISGDESASGKLISGTRWYLAVRVPYEALTRITEGEYLTVHFSGDFSQDVEMKVEQAEKAAEGSYGAVVLSSDRHLSETTLLREQSVELIFESHTGLRIPKMALRMVTIEKTDSETGEVTEEIRKIGVYVLVAGKLEFKEVETIAEGSDYFVVRSVKEGGSALIPGDEIVVRGTDLYAGKLLEN